MLWMSLVLFLIPVAYVLIENSADKRLRQNELDRIRRRLEEKEAEAQKEQD